MKELRVASLPVYDADGVHCSFPLCVTAQGLVVDLGFHRVILEDVARQYGATDFETLPDVQRDTVLRITKKDRERPVSRRSLSFLG